MGKYETLEILKRYILQFGLFDWWNSEFSEEERTYMNKKYQPLPNFGMLALKINECNDELIIVNEIGNPKNTNYKNGYPFDFDSDNDRLMIKDKSTGRLREFDEDSEEIPGLCEALLEEVEESKINYRHPALFLAGLASYFNNLKDGSIALRCLKKSEELFDMNIPPIDLHFYFQALIEVYYRHRYDLNSLDRFISISKKSIHIAPMVAKSFKEKYPWNDNLPHHYAYNQYVIFKEKNKDYKDAIDICYNALKEGWAGDWEKRIARCRKKLNSQ